MTYFYTFPAKLRSVFEKEWGVPTVARHGGETLKSKTPALQLSTWPVSRYWAVIVCSCIESLGS